MTILGGRFHEVDSNALDFHIAGSMAVRQALHQARPGLLEPVMHADIGVSEVSLGTVMADFTRRRGDIHDLQMRGNNRHILGEVPLSEVRGYVTALRDMTSGRGDFSLEFRTYAIVPDGLAEAVIEERQARGKVARR